jgi:hypothetical protein
MSVSANIQRALLLSVLGYTAYIVASCPCETMGQCKKEQFLALSLVPLGFAVYNFVGNGDETCAKS